MNNTFYFPHDYDAMQDEKIKRMLRKHGMIGYGVFWAIIEMLYINANALRTDYEGIAYDFRTNSDIVESVICDFDLFIIRENEFGSLSVERRLNERNEKSRKAKESANFRWKNANALRTDCEGNAIKENKRNEIKEEINTGKATAFIPPTVGDIQSYCKERNNTVDAAYFFDFYSSKGWMVGKNKMKDWQAAVRTWERTENTNIKTSNRNEQTESQSRRYKQL